MFPQGKSQKLRRNQIASQDSQKAKVKSKKQKEGEKGIKKSGLAGRGKLRNMTHEIC